MKKISHNVWTDGKKQFHGSPKIGFTPISKDTKIDMEKMSIVNNEDLTVEIMKEKFAEIDSVKEATAFELKAPKKEVDKEDKE